ncbi:hypothetical protein OG21DRAFT_1508968 [Imleria badia]|nr:hypothetical protein OG21DRAFT_1508968 [Imleria badia]
MAIPSSTSNDTPQFRPIPIDAHAQAMPRLQTSIPQCQRSPPLPPYPMSRSLFLLQNFPALAGIPFAAPPSHCSKDDDETCPSGSGGQ